MSQSSADLVLHFVPTIHHDTYEFISTLKLSLKGKNVFITGASKGIGRATAISYARAGASGIALAARSSLSSLESELVSAAEEAGHPAPKVCSYEMDVTDREAIERTAKQVEKDFSGHLDILINNAGYLEVFTPVADSDPDEWWKTWTINLRGPYLVTRSLLPMMLKAGDKQILNISSMGALRTRMGASAYQASKMTICRFTEFIVEEYSEQGVIAIAVHPGGVWTELSSAMPKHTHGILVDKAEMAGDAMVYLTSEKRDWLSGRYLSVTWDMEEFLQKKDEIVERDLLKFRMAVG